jgi:hypothetical protein
MFEKTICHRDSKKDAQVELIASHKRTVDKKIVDTVLQALGEEKAFLRRFVEKAGKTSLVVHVAVTGKEDVSGQLSFKGGRFSVVLPQRAKSVAMIASTVEQKFIECAIKEELISLGTQYVLDGRLRDEEEQVLCSMAERYDELTRNHNENRGMRENGASSQNRGFLWRRIIDQHRHELEATLKSAHKRNLPCIATGSDSSTHEKVQHILKTLAEERAISLLLGANSDLSSRLLGVVEQVKERFASAVWHQRTDEAQDCVASLRLLQQGLQDSVFDRGLPSGIRPDKSQQTRGRSIRELVAEDYLQRQEFSSDRRLHKSAGDISGLRLMITQLAHTYDRALEFEHNVKAVWGQEEQIFERVMEHLLESVEELGLALSEDKADRAQVVSKVFELLVGLRLSGNENGSMFFTFAFSGYSPMDQRPGARHVSPQVLAKTYVEFLSQASSIYNGRLDPHDVRMEPYLGLGDVAARTLRILIYAYENSLAEQLALADGAPQEQLGFIARDVNNIEIALGRVAPFGSCEELRKMYETDIGASIRAVRVAARQLYLLTLTGEELVSDKALPNDDNRKTLLSNAIREVSQILENRAREYVDAVAEAAHVELPSIVEGTSLGALVDRIEQLVKLSEAYPNPGRDKKLYALVDRSLAEMVEVVHQGYGSEIDLVNKLAEPGTDAQHVSYVIRALEALGIMVSELSHLRGRLRGVSDLDPQLFLKVDLFIDQIPKHFSRNVRRYPNILDKAIERLARSETAGEEALTEQQRAMCLRGFESLPSFKRNLTKERRISLEKLLRRTHINRMPNRHTAL